MKSSKKLVFLLVFALATVCGGVGSSDAALKKTCFYSGDTDQSFYCPWDRPNNSQPRGLIRTAARRTSRASVTWSSSAKSVATISNVAGSKGKATSKAAGTTTITAKSGRISGSTSPDGHGCPCFYPCNPTNPSIILGTTEQFTAIGIYSDNSTKDITTSVTWSSSAESVATISNAAGSNGKATSVAAGTTTITATSGNISGSTTLTVTPGEQRREQRAFHYRERIALLDQLFYLNKPCVSVTVCTPGTSTCQAIDDILLDTGSYGLRLFKQVLNVSLVQATSGSGSLAECVQFGDGSSDWGPVQIASVILGNEPAVAGSDSSH